MKKFNQKCLTRYCKTCSVLNLSETYQYGLIKMEHFVIIVNSWKLLSIITKSSILDVATVLDLPLLASYSKTLNFLIIDFIKFCFTR